MIFKVVVAVVVIIIILPGLLLQLWYAKVQFLATNTPSLPSSRQTV
jgi:hypothetical protein